jgi:hypothetical protein
MMMKVVERRTPATVRAPGAERAQDTTLNHLLPFAFQERTKPRWGARAVLFVLVMALIQGCARGQGPIVDTPQGPVQGVRQGGEVEAFFGIPYATAPGRPGG